MKVELIDRNALIKELSNYEITFGLFHGRAERSINRILHEDIPDVIRSIPFYEIDIDD